MSEKEQRSYFQSLKRSAVSMLSMMPMILAIVGLVGLFQSYITQQMLVSVFDGNAVHDTLVGTLAGMVAVGQAIVSYILGGELLEQGVSLYAVTAFVLAWVTLGVVQLPMEASVLGVGFTWRRNLLAFLSTILVSVVTVRVLELWR